MEWKIKIWVMWSAQWPTLTQQKSILKAESLWSALAELWCIVVTWACPGLPNEAAIGAKQAWWFVIWMSPAYSEYEHKVIYSSPVTAYDIIVYTWEGLIERDITNIRSSDAIILVWWWVWTLNEFSIAFLEGKIIWVLKWTGGISEKIPEIMKISSSGPAWRVIIESDPKKLAHKVVLAVREYAYEWGADARFLKK